MDSTFYLAALAIVVGAITFITRSCFASKCVRFQVGWGCIDVERDVDNEMQDIHQSNNVEEKEGRNRSNTCTDLELERTEKQESN